MERRHFSSAGALGLALLAACSPVFNWREVPLGADGVAALLPCKPDRATRTLPLGGEPVELQMIGCQAGGATFALARTSAADIGQARARLAAWRAATRAQWDGATIDEQTASLLRAAEAPAPVALRARGSADKGRNAQGRMLWFVHLAKGGRLGLYQATVLGEPSSAEATATFFEGIHLP